MWSWSQADLKGILTFTETSLCARCHAIVLMSRISFAPFVILWCRYFKHTFQRCEGYYCYLHLGRKLRHRGKPAYSKWSSYKMADWSSEASLGEPHSPPSSWLTNALHHSLSQVFSSCAGYRTHSLCTWGKPFTTELLSPGIMWRYSKWHFLLIWHILFHKSDWFLAGEIWQSSKGTLRGQLLGHSRVITLARASERIVGQESPCGAGMIRTSTR